MKMLVWDGRGITKDGRASDTPSTDAEWYIEISGAADPAALREQLKKFKAFFELEGSTLRFPPRPLGDSRHIDLLLPLDALQLVNKLREHLVGVEVGGLDRLIKAATS